MAEQKYICPCCGYRTLEEPRGSYSICQICFWEADYDWDTFEGSGPNNTTLNEGRLIFLGHGAMSHYIAAYVREPTPEDLPQRPPMKPRATREDLESRVARRIEQLDERFEWRRVAEMHVSAQRTPLPRAVGRLELLPYPESWKRDRVRMRLTEHQFLELEFPQLYEEWLVLLEYHDPIELGESLYGWNYDAQIRWLVPYLLQYSGPGALQEAIYVELGRWFRQEIVDPLERYENLALDAWASWERNRQPVLDNQDFPPDLKGSSR